MANESDPHTPPFPPQLVDGTSPAASLRCLVAGSRESRSSAPVRRNQNLTSKEGVT